MPEEPTEEQTVKVACLACGLKATWREGPLSSCPRCDAEALAVEKPDGSRLVDSKVSEAQELAGRTGIDIGFALAVLAQKLTVEQAKSKGNREATAQQSATKYGISLKAAYQVADGKLRPQDAVKQKEEGAAELRKMVKETTSPVAVILILLAIIVLVGGYFYVSRAPAPNKAQPTQLVATDSGSEVLYNAAGELTYVKATGPAQVLNLYCRAKPQRHQLDVVWVDTKNAKGIFEEMGTQGVFERKVIQIQHNEEGKYWSVGDRASAVPTKPL